MYGITHVSSPDGRFDASACGSHIALWERNDTDPFRILRSVPRVAITSVAWSQDGCNILAGMSDGKVQAWNASTGEELYRCCPPIPLVAVRCVCSSQSHVAVLHGTNYVQILSIADGQFLTLIQSPVRIKSLQWSPDGQVLYADSEPLWSPTDGCVFPMMDQILRRTA